MVIIAGIALVIDTITALLTFRLAKGSANMRAAFLHNITDALGSIGVIIAGTLVILFDWWIVDPIVTLGIAGYILWHVFREIGGVIRILMLGRAARHRCRGGARRPSQTAGRGRASTISTSGRSTSTATRCRRISSLTAQAMTRPEAMKTARAERSPDTFAIDHTDRSSSNARARSASSASTIGHDRRLAIGH